MTAERAYLDWNATAPLHPAAREALAAGLALVGNPSSVHAEGRAARGAIEQARARVAARVGADVENVVFTSGATEALSRLIATWPGPVRFGATEHAAVRAAVPADAVALPVDGDGVIEARMLDRALAGLEGALVVIQLANNETGVVQPVADLAARVRAAGATLLVDAAQAIGRLAVDLPTLGADALVLSGHKFGAPKGVGAVAFGPRERFPLRPLIAGGGQERGWRGGTENLAGILAMGAAAEAADPAVADGLRARRDELISAMRAIRPDLVVFGEAAERLPNTIGFAVPALPAERALIAFDLDGVALSSGAACSSGKVRASDVLAAMGVAPDRVAGALRLSFGLATPEVDFDRFLSSFRRLAGAGARRQVA